jgi:hypothetical protein
LLNFDKLSNEDQQANDVFAHLSRYAKEYPGRDKFNRLLWLDLNTYLCDDILMMTDREDLDDQIWRTFIGCGVTDEKTPRATSGKELQSILRENHRFVFSLIHKFNQPVKEPYSERDDIIVISDEAHRTQAGKFARNMRLALPNAAYFRQAQNGIVVRMALLYQMLKGDFC